MNLKTFAAVLLGTAALLALGAGAASATELCSTNTHPCTGTKYGTGTSLKAQLATGTTATLTTSIGNVVCTSATLAGKTTTAGSEVNTVEGEFTSETFSNCTLGSTACEVRSSGFPTFSIFATGGGNASVTVFFFRVWASCGSFINCEFSGGQWSLALTGGNPAHLTASKASMAGINGFFCPKEGLFDATYRVTSPAPLFAV